MQLKEMKKRSHVPFTQFSPSAKTCKTTVHYHNQDINVETLKTQSISFTMGSLLGQKARGDTCAATAPSSETGQRGFVMKKPTTG